MPTLQSTNLVVPRALIYIAGGALIASILAVGKDVLAPLTLAAVIGFVLIRPVAKLEAWGLPRALSVALILSLALTLVAGFGYVLGQQFADLAAQTPRYRTSIKSKLATLRATRSPLGQIQETVTRVQEELDKQDSARRQSAAGAAGERPDVQPVSVVWGPPSDVENLRSFLQTIVEPVATGGFVVILVMYILMKREDIRDRFLRLVGHSRVTLTTRTLDDAGQRISVLLTSQLVLNTCFGIVISVGLQLIGIPYALLWGMTAGLLRFVPYLGSMLAMLMPAALAFVLGNGWGMALMTFALFATCDVITAYFIEPVWIGNRTGISSLALLLSALVWTWLWGPLGLLLSMPITVCLVAIGSNVPEMEFLAVLLGDMPPLEPQVAFYQRLVAADEDGAAEILDREAATQSREAAFDGVLAPSLRLAARDRMRDQITAEEHQFVLETIADIARRTFAEVEAAAEPAAVRQRVLGVPTTGDASALALELFGYLLGPDCTLTTLSPALLVSELVSAIEQEKPDALCITTVAPGGTSRIRDVCKRVRRRLPELPILVLRVGSDAGSKLADQLVSDGATYVAISFTDACAQLRSMNTQRRDAA